MSYGHLAKEGNLQRLSYESLLGFMDTSHGMISALIYACQYMCLTCILLLTRCPLSAKAWLSKACSILHGKAPPPPIHLTSPPSHPSCLPYTASYKTCVSLSRIDPSTILFFHALPCNHGANTVPKSAGQVSTYLQLECGPFLLPRDDISELVS